jgi:cysteine desulfurase/selenocysteine lyase
VVREVIYLNNAAGGWPKAPGVVEAMNAAIQAPPYSPGRSDSSFGDPVSECRARLAALLEAEDPSRIVLTSGATHALNLAILGLGLRNQAHVVTTVTEHNSVLRPLNHLAVRGDVRITVIGLDGSGHIDIESFDAALRDEPKLVAVNHMSNVTGRVCDVGPLFERAKAVGAVTLLDASQSIGHVPVHPEELHADLVAFTGHKGLHGPSGVGVLFVAPWIDLDRVLVGGTGVRSDLDLHPEDMPIRLEAGTPNVPAIAGLAAALKWRESNGPACEANARRLGRLLNSGLEEMRSVRVFSSVGDTEDSGIVSFRAEGWSVDEAGIVLQESFGIICRTGLHCAPLVHRAIGSAPDGTIRLSLSGLSSDSDIGQAIDAVRRLAA